MANNTQSLEVVFGIIQLKENIQQSQRKCETSKTPYSWGNTFLYFFTPIKKMKKKCKKVIFRRERYLETLCEKKW